MNKRIETFDTDKKGRSIFNLEGVGSGDTPARVTRTATLVVAANNSSVKSKAQADYICPANDALAYITDNIIPLLPVGGGKIILLEGTYTISTDDEPLEINTRNNITIQGQGRATVLNLADGITSNIIRVIDSSGITIRDLYCDGTTTAADGGSDINQCGILFNNVDESKIDNVWSFNNRRYGISIYNDSDENEIIGCQCQNNILYGILIYSSCDNNNIIGCTIQGNQDDGMLIGNACTNNTISGNTIQNNGNYGILVDNACINNVFVANIIQGNTNAGIYIGTNCDNNTVSGNTVVGNDMGIYLSGADYNNITGNVVNGHTAEGILGDNGNANTVSGNIVRDNASYGIGLCNCLNSTVTGNTSESNSDIGIYISGSPECTITGNTCYNNNPDGIEVTNGSDHCTISGNTISQNIRRGIDMTSNYCIISGNNIYANEYSGIYQDADYGEIIGNIIHSNDRHGISFSGANNNVIAENNIYDNGKEAAATYDGIILSASDYNLIQNNKIRQGVGFTHRYGINIFNATCEENFVKGNDLYDSGGTGYFNDTGTNTIYSESRSEMFMDLLAADTDYVHAAITGTGAEQEITTNITNPDVPRNISITNSANSTGVVTITGVDAKGNAITEDITIVTGGTAYGDKAFSIVSKITIPAGVANPDTISVGVSDKLGLSNIVYKTGDVYKVKVNNADATGQFNMAADVDVTNDTVDMSSLDAGGITAGDDITIYYRSNLNIIS